MVLFFFVKQKTAYEMRISDWSSDVCSSDLLVGLAALQRGSGDGDRPCHPGPGVRGDRLLSVGPWLADMDRPQMAQAPALPGFPEPLTVLMVRLPFEGVDAGARRVSYGRSEEHTSELPSLMRISYAVLCLKKKKII